MLIPFVMRMKERFEKKETLFNIELYFAQHSLVEIKHP